MDRLGNYINQFSEAFGNVYGAINPQRPAATANRDARQSNQWLPFAIGGGVLLLVVVLILVGTRK